MQPKDSVRWDRCCSVRNRRAWSGRIIHLVSNPRAVAATAEAECLTGGGATFSTVRAAAVWSSAASIGVVFLKGFGNGISRLPRPPVLHRYSRGNTSVATESCSRGPTDESGHAVIAWHVKAFFR